MPAMIQTAANEEPFGARLIRQTGAGGSVGQIAAAAAGDRSFPRDSDVEAARKWLAEKRPSGNDWEVLDDAEIAWLAY